MRSDADMQTMLLSNLILTGGCACIDGLSERLKTEGRLLVVCCVTIVFVCACYSLQIYCPT